MAINLLLCLSDSVVLFWAGFQLVHAGLWMDAYEQGLNGKQAVWALKKYSSHQVLIESIIMELDETNIASINIS
jgi:hypothetical protein